MGKRRGILWKKREITWNIYSKDKVKESKGGIKNMEYSMYNSHNVCSVDFEFATEIRAEGLLHGTRF